MQSSGHYSFARPSEPAGRHHYDYLRREPPRLHANEPASHHHHHLSYELASQQRYEPYQQPYDAPPQHYPPPHAHTEPQQPPHQSAPPPLAAPAPPSPYYLPYHRDEHPGHP